MSLGNTHDRHKYLITEFVLEMNGKLIHLSLCVMFFL